MADTLSSLPALPAGACDCHAHVFGPFERFPLADPRPYTPPEAKLDDYLAMLDAAGMARGVLVQGGANGWDHGALLDALRAAPQRLRGIVVPNPHASDAELESWHAAGVRGVRFTQVAGPSAAQRFDGRIDLSELPSLAPRLRELKWHVQLWANCAVIEEQEAMIRTLGLPVVIDHMGFFDVSRGFKDSAFQALARLLADGYVWVKLTAFRNSRTAPDYSDVRAFHDTLVAANPDQVVWGSDWPFLGMNGPLRPTVDALLRQLMEWLPEEEIREKVLSRNPAKLYGFKS